MGKISNVARVLSIFLKYRGEPITWGLLMRETELSKSSLKYALDRMIEKGVIEVIKKDRTRYYVLSSIESDVIEAFLPLRDELDSIRDLLEKPTSKFHYLFREKLAGYFLNVFVESLFGTYCMLRLARSKDPLLLNTKKILASARAGFEWFFRSILEVAVKEISNIIFENPENLISAFYLTGIIDLDNSLTFTFMNKKYLESWLDGMANQIRSVFNIENPNDAVDIVYDLLLEIKEKAFGNLKEINTVLEIRKEYLDEISELHIIQLEKEIITSSYPKGIIIVYNKGIFYIDSKNVGQRGAKILQIGNKTRNGIKFNNTDLKNLLIRIQELIKQYLHKNVVGKED